jgi:hypothetical protein
MKKIMIICMFLSIVGCVSPNKNIAITHQTGWSDEDTYTVKVIGSNEENAIDKAKHQILKDIVDVRLRNNSKYTDIEKIRQEFALPLQNGIIIDRATVPDGLQIYFQIRDKGLKNKFHRV